MPDDLISHKLEGLQRSLETTPAELGRRLDKLDTQIGKRLDKVNRQLDGLAASAQKVAETQNELRRQLDALGRQVTTFIDEESAARKKQFAQTALVDARAEYDRRFGHYQTVRRSTTGMLRAMATGTVRPAAFLRAAEQLMFDAIDYWLPPAQVAMAAWTSNSPVSAERAALEAVNRDPGQSALFFSLVLARFGRQDAAAHWVAEYAKTQDGNALTGEFTAVLDAVARGAIGSRARQCLLEACRGWGDQVVQSDERKAQQLASWTAFIRGQRRPLADTFHALGTASHDWITILGRLETAAVFGHMEQWLKGRLGSASESDETLRAAADDLLRDLIAAPDQAECAVLEAAKGWQAIVESDGRPPPPTSREPGKPIRTDFLTLCTAIATRTYMGELSEQAVRFCIILSETSIEQAVTDLSQLVRSSYPTSIEVDIEGWHHALEPGDDPEALVQKFLGWAHEAMLEDKAQAMRKRLSIGRTSARLENIETIWEARKQRGQEKVDLVTRQANFFFQKWQQEMAASERCVDLLRAQQAGAWSDAQESHAVAGPTRPALNLPDWDPHPAAPPAGSPQARTAS